MGFYVNYVLKDSFLRIKQFLIDFDLNFFDKSFHNLKTLDKLIKNGWKMVKKWSKNDFKMVEKWLKNDWKIVEKRLKMVEKWLKNGWKMAENGWI